jgi:hypothetical protein
MPGGVGGAASRGVPLSRSRSFIAATAEVITAAAHTAAVITAHTAAVITADTAAVMHIAAATVIAAARRHSAQRRSAQRLSHPIVGSIATAPKSVIKSYGPGVPRVLDLFISGQTARPTLSRYLIARHFIQSENDGGQPKVNQPVARPVKPGGWQIPAPDSSRRYFK